MDDRERITRIEVLLILEVLLVVIVLISISHIALQQTVEPRFHLDLWSSLDILEAKKKKEMWRQ